MVVALAMAYFGYVNKLFFDFYARASLLRCTPSMALWSVRSQGASLRTVSQQGQLQPVVAASVEGFQIFIFIYRDSLWLETAAPLGVRM